MGSLFTCCIKNDDITTEDPFLCKCGGTLMEHGCSKCHTGSRCECSVPVEFDGDKCDMCEREEAIENSKDRIRPNKRGYNVDFSNSGGRI
jgi:hypothetical protein